MARHSADREDLFAEIVALVPRIAFVISADRMEVVYGEHRDGRWSIYLNSDPVYHFDVQNRLRRAFVGGHLFRSQGQTLARLTRQATQTETQLLRHDLAHAELADWLGQMQRDLGRIAHAIKADQVAVSKIVPEDASILPEVLRKLTVVVAEPCQLAPAIR